MYTRRSLISGAILVVLTLDVLFGQQTASPPASTAPELVVTLDAGQLTIRAANVPLDAVLAEVSTRTGIAIEAAAALESRHISAWAKSAPVEQAIRELLKNYDAFFLYSAAARQSASLTTVWVYPRGAATNLRPVPPEAWASSKEFEVALADGDASIREQAYEALLSRPDRHSQNLVLLAIRGASETDSELRQRLLSSAISRGVAIPRDVLADLVRADATEEIRFIALDGLAGDPASREAISAALSDPSDVVRNRARDILAELDTMLHRRDPER